MSDTPRTDAASKPWATAYDGSDDAVVPAYFARQLERELTGRQSAAAALTVPAGWKLVPEKPTDEMLDALYAENDFDSYDGMLMCWRAMLATSPRSPSAIYRKKQMTKAERYAPIILREIGERHYCNRRVVGARGKWAWVYCRHCNIAAIAIAKKIARADSCLPKK